MDPIQRVKMLNEFIQQNPSDPFPRYSLALEYATNLEQFDKAAELFAALVADSPDYVASYLMYGNLLSQKLDDRDAARNVYQAGIEVATKAGDGHAASELRGALAELEESA